MRRTIAVIATALLLSACPTPGEPAMRSEEQQEAEFRAELASTDPDRPSEPSDAEGEVPSETELVPDECSGAECDAEPSEDLPTTDDICDPTCADDDVAFDQASFCTTAAAISDNTTTQLTLDPNDPAAVEGAASAELGQFTEALQTAPDSLRDDLETLVAGSETLVAALRNAGWDPQAVDPATVAQVTADIAGSRTRLDEFSGSECGIETSAEELRASAYADSLTGEPWGFTAEEARCIVETIDPDLLVTGATTEDIVDVARQCLSAERLATLGYA